MQPREHTEKVGPSWADVYRHMAEIQGAYGGFVLCQMVPAITTMGRPRALWVVKWAPDLIHAHLAHYRGASTYMPAVLYRTVPEALQALLRLLDTNLRHDEEHRRKVGLPRLSQMVLPPVPECPQSVT